MEKVYKSFTGWKPEDDKNWATHVLLSLDEYNALKDEIRASKSETERIIKEAEVLRKDFVTKYNKIVDDANQQTSQQKENHLLELDKLEREIEKAYELNRNLQRICRQRANKDKNLLGRNNHHGYLIASAREYIYVFHYYTPKKDSQNFACWHVTLQTPHDLTIPEHIARATILKDFERFLFFDFKAKNAVKTSKFVGISGVKELIELYEQDDNLIFNISLKVNSQRGFWEVEFFARDIYVPAEMIIASNTRKK